MTVTAHLILSENAHYSQNVQDFRSCILEALDSVGVNALNALKCPVEKGDMFKQRCMISHRPVT